MKFTFRGKKYQIRRHSIAEGIIITAIVLAVIIVFNIPGSIDAAQGLYPR